MGPKKNSKIIAGFFLFFLLGACTVLAAKSKLKAITSEGTLRFEDGTEISLLGLHLHPEGLPLLFTLLSRGEEVEIDYDRSAPNPETGPKPAYIWVKISEGEFKQVHSGTSEKRIQVNEMLLSWGAAKADAVSEYKQKARFLEIEKQARENGSGIWSYEKP